VFVFHCCSSIHYKKDIGKTIQTINEYRQTGNDYFRTGALSKAHFQYHCAHLYILEMEKTSKNQFVNMIQGNTEVDPTPEEKEQLNVASLSIFNNMSAVYVKQGKHKKAVEFATKALEIEPDNVKALFRRGKSFIAINEIDKAEQDLEKANSLTGGSDNTIKRAIVELKNKRTKIDKKQKEFFAKCLSG